MKDGMAPQAAAEKAFKRVEEIFAKYPMRLGAERRELKARWPAVGLVAKLEPKCCRERVAAQAGKETEWPF